MGISGFLGLWILFYVSPDIRLIEQDVEMISVAHCADGAELVFFWDFVQGDFTLLDYKYISDMIIWSDGLETSIYWHDNNCYRLITTKCWAESWEDENPTSLINRGAWFVRIVMPGLKQ